MLRGAIRLLLALSCLTLFACTGNDVMDAFCTPDAPDITLNDDCPYQNARGPQIPNPECKASKPDPASAATWTDVFAIFVDQNRGNCSAGGCHGIEEKAANGIFLPSNNTQKFYDTLVNTKGSVGKPYVNVDDPLSSWIHCNVAGTPGGGLPMPKPAGLPSKKDADIVEDWVLGGAAGP
jgi:hypothetical protein